VRAKKLPIDYEALRQTYARMLAGGPFANQADLARHLGVSRVWVSRVLKGMKKSTG
jgi:Mn-dependent DtxR family transcriptional regulator